MSRIRIALSSLMLIGLCQSSSADVVQLKSGGILRGTIKTDAKSKSDVLEVQLMSGTLVVVGKEDVVDRKSTRLNSSH